MKACRRSHRSRPASSPYRLTSDAIAIAIQMRAIAGFASSYRGSARSTDFSTIRIRARAVRCACRRDPQWRVIVAGRSIAARWRTAAAMTMVATALAVVMAAFGVESTTVGGGVRGDAQRDDDERRHPKNAVERSLQCYLCVCFGHAAFPLRNVLRLRSKASNGDRTSPTVTQIAFP